MRLQFTSYNIIQHPFILDYYRILLMIIEKSNSKILILEMICYRFYIHQSAEEKHSLNN